MTLMTPVRALQVPLSDFLKKRSAITALKRNGFIELPIDPGFLRKRASLVIDGMRAVTESERLSNLFPWHTHIADAYGKKYEQEAGLKHETSDGENKYVFQYISGAMHAYGQMGAPSGDLFEAASAQGLFLRALGDIDTMARSIALAIANYMDTAYGHSRPYHGSLCERLRDGVIVVRVLRYLPVPESANDAIPHIDRSLFTLHILATHEGLWIVLPSGEKVRIRECTHDTVCAFFGRKLMAATRGAVNGTPHGVKYQRMSREDRFSIVVFIHPKATDGDVEWLLANDATVRAYEQRILL